MTIGLEMFRETVNLQVWQPHRIARTAPERTNLT